MCNGQHLYYVMLISNTCGITWILDHNHNPFLKKQICNNGWPFYFQKNQLCFPTYDFSFFIFYNVYFKLSIEPKKKKGINIGVAAVINDIFQMVFPLVPFSVYAIWVHLLLKKYWVEELEADIKRLLVFNFQNNLSSSSCNWFL